MKRLFALFLTILLISCSVLCTSATTVPLSGTKIIVEYLDNGDYIETTITWEESVTRSTKTASKTANYKNSDGETLWSVTVRGTFTYDGTTSTCTSCSHSAATYSSAITIKSVSSSKSGNTATATAVATIKVGFISQDLSLSTTLTCSPTGVLS